MARHKSAMKRHRQGERRRVRNQAVRSSVRTVIKKTRQAIATGDATAAAASLRITERLLGKAVTKGVLHRNAASRYISRLSRGVHALPRV
jgi:small subunit ribosomal protein S20